MRVLILTIYHDPEPIPKTGELARELQKRGHDVTVVTAFPHYPAGSLYEGYQLALWHWERREGIRVLRTFIYPYHGRRSSLRMVNYLTWMISSVQAAWLTGKCDVLYVWHPPLTVGVSAWLISKLKRIPYVYDVQDLWPESALASGLMKDGVLVRVLHRLADWVYAVAPRILVVSRAAAKSLQDRGVNPAKVSVARHWVDISAFQIPTVRDVRAEFDWQKRFVVMFTGNLGMVQGLETVIQAADLLRSNSNIHFVFVGDGADYSRLKGLAKHLDNVQFVGRHPVSAMPDFMRTADALVVHLRPSDIADNAIPTKILSYMAAERPILCATGGACAELIREADAGLVVEPGNARDLAAAVTRLASMTSDQRKKMGESGRRYLVAHFEKTRVIDSYEQILIEMTNASRLSEVAARQRS